MCSDSGVVDIGGKKRNISVLLDDMSTNRIGLGNGEFFIDQKFVLTVSVIPYNIGFYIFIQVIFLMRTLITYPLL